MNQIRDILNKLKWHHQSDFLKVELWYIHRGAPNNIKIITGAEIKSNEKTFIETEEAMIPHHRIFKITLNDTILFDRNKIS